MEKKYLLIVEDDKEINKLLCEFLKSQGYETLSVGNGLDAVKAFRENKRIQMVLLDIMLPFQSGDMVLKKIREVSDVPVIMISAKDTIQTKIDILRMGADDYITKPFDLDEVLVRMETVLRRSRGKVMTVIEDVQEEEICFRNMRLDLVEKRAYVKGEPLLLTSKEYGILELMLKNPKKLFSKANLFESVWNETYYSEDNTLKVHMSNIRNKIKQYDEVEYIQTVWGMGYKLVE